MPKVPRNAPCPCGSGLKYKRCCLRQVQAEDRQIEQTCRAIRVATDWLENRYGHLLGKVAEEQFIAGLDDEARARLGQLPQGLGEMFVVNATEFVLAEAVLSEEGGKPFQIKDVLFAPGGPLLEAKERKYLEDLCAQPLGLYEVVSVRRGKGVEVRELEDPGAPTLWVRERSGSQTMAVGLVLGARIVEYEAAWTFSGGLYPFSEPVVPDLLEQRRAIRRERTAAAGKALRLSLAIIDAWLWMLTQPPPTLVDQGSGEPTLLVTDHYEILDHEGLAAALEAEPDVASNGAHGWALLEDPKADFSRTRLALNLCPEKGDRLENFARSQGYADRGREWFERIAGATVRHLIRDSVDPLAAMQQGLASETAPSQAPPIELPEGFLQEFMEKNLYKNWADEPIPMLGNKTPRQCLRSKAGRQRVIDLLESYERQEKTAAREKGRPPIDQTFLWQSLGLERP